MRIGRQEGFQRKGIHMVNATQLSPLPADLSTQNPGTERPERADAGQERSAQRISEPAQQDTVELNAQNLYNLKFDFYYERVQSTSRKAVFLQDDSARTLSQELYQKVSARYSLDLSFLGQLADASGRSAAIDQETYEKFVRAAQGLADFSQESLGEFTRVVDDLFNAVESAFSLSSDALDGFAGVIKDSVKSFFGDVRSVTDSFAANAEADQALFQNRLQELFRPEEKKDGPFAELKQLLDEAGVPERLQKDIFKLISVISDYLQKQDPRQQPLFDFQKFAEEIAANETPAVRDEDDPTRETQPEQPRALSVYESTSLQESVSISVQQTRLDLAA